MFRFDIMLKLSFPDLDVWRSHQSSGADARSVPFDPGRGVPGSIRVVRGVADEGATVHPPLPGRAAGLGRLVQADVLR